jgi:hypothetical protein
MVGNGSRGGPRLSRQGGRAQAFREWLEPFSEYHSEPLDYIGVGILRRADPAVGIGRASGAPVEIEVTYVFQFRDHMITRIDEYDTLKEALEAVGLPE